MASTADIEGITPRPLVLPCIDKRHCDGLPPPLPSKESHHMPKQIHYFVCIPQLEQVISLSIKI